MRRKPLELRRTLYRSRAKLRPEYSLRIVVDKETEILLVVEVKVRKACVSIWTDWDQSYSRTVPALISTTAFFCLTL